METPFSPHARVDSGPTAPSRTQFGAATKVSMNIVIVESPAKAKTVNKYLGPNYRVLASYGHVRDLPSKNGSVLPDEDFEMLWDVDPKSAKRLNEIAQALKGADKLILATDPDREGEAISWHVLQILDHKKVLGKIPVERVVFNAVTKEAVLEAMRHPREIDEPLVNAYLARRALDYLVGFTLSPVLWRKLPGAKSAGRVQSVALRLVCDRELEIEKFRAQEYWSIAAELATGKKETFQARLVSAEGKKLEKFDIPNQSHAEQLKTALEGGRFSVANVESKSQRRHPAAPFTTSTLQQEASRKLGFSPRQTMQLAQRLYEGIDLGGEAEGLITYMRTDGVQIVPEAVSAIRKLVTGRYGDRYVPPSPRQYEAKAKNAQEAHEAIRPTDFNGGADGLVGLLCVLGLGLVLARGGRHVAVAVAAGDQFADGRDGLRHDLHAVRPHISNETFGFAAEIDTFIEALGELHGLARREAELARGLLLKRRGGEGRGRMAALRLALDIGDGETSAFECRLQLLGMTLVGDVELLKLLAFGGDKSCLEGFLLAGGELGGDRPIFLGPELLDLQLAVADETQRD